MAGNCISEAPGICVRIKIKVESLAIVIKIAIDRRSINVNDFGFLTLRPLCAPAGLSTGPGNISGRTLLRGNVCS